MHHRDFAAAEESLVKTNIAKPTKEIATTQQGVSIADVQQILEFYSPDRGGRNFKSRWGDLERL